MVFRESFENFFSFIEDKNTFTIKEGSDMYKIREGLHLDWNSEKMKNTKSGIEEVVLHKF